MVRVTVCLVVVVWATTLSVIDLWQRRLPNALTVPGAVIVLAVSAGCGRGGPALFGAAALGGLYLAIHLVDPGGLGAGDVKLAVGLGALTGALGVAVWLLAAIGAPLITAVAGTAVLLRRRGPMVLPPGPMMLPPGPMMLPHGPSMCLASLAAAALAVL